MKDTKIEWCDSTWNPVTGCFHGCEYCYARGIAKRFGGTCYTTRTYYDGDFDQIITETEEKIHDLRTPIKDWDKGGKKSPYPFEFDPTFHRYRLKQPKVWHEPRVIFVCSMADLFGAWVPDEWIDEVFKVCEETPHHNYMFLTKNPARYIQLANDGKLPQSGNMWYGTTLTNPDSPYVYCGKDTRNMFLSIEPILEDMGNWRHGAGDKNIKWIIVGAETGNRKDKAAPKKAWIDNLANECKKHNIPLFMKDSLIPIVSEKNMKREFPTGLRKGEQA